MDAAVRALPRRGGPPVPWAGAVPPKASRCLSCRAAAAACCGFIVAAFVSRLLRSPLLCPLAFSCWVEPIKGALWQRQGRARQVRLSEQAECCHGRQKELLSCFSTGGRAGQQPLKHASSSFKPVRGALGCGIAAGTAARSPRTAKRCCQCRCILAFLQQRQCRVHRRRQRASASCSKRAKQQAAVERRRRRHSWGRAQPGRRCYEVGLTSR